MNFRISGQRVHLSSKVRYLGVILQENLEREQHLNTLTPKLNRALGLLAKIRHYLPKSLLKTICFSFFNSHLIYACQIWGQREDLINKISAIQDKAIRIINFKPKNYPAGKLYQSNKILKLRDYIRLINSMYVKSVLEDTHLRIFTYVFKKANEIHNYTTRLSLRNSVKITQPKTETYGRYSIKHQCTTSWNNLQTHISIDVVTKSDTKVKNALMNYFLLTYDRD